MLGYSFFQEHAELRLRFFVAFLPVITSPSWRSKTPKSKTAILKEKSGTALAVILTQCNISH
jgi:hypothetical protein